MREESKQEWLHLLRGFWGLVCILYATTMIPVTIISYKMMIMANEPFMGGFLLLAAVGLGYVYINMACYITKIKLKFWGWMYV